MPYGSMSDELQIVLNGHGITFHPPQDSDDDRPGDEHTHVRIDVIYAGALDECFDVDYVENDVEAIVDAIFEHITTRDYAKGESVTVDAYETNGDDYNERIYVRETESAG